jgi:diacylglycerol kinase (ATP)
MKYKIIVNPAAARGGSQKVLPKIENELKRLGVNYDIVHTRYSWHAADLAQQAVVTGYDVVVGAGGDGTVNEVMNGLILAQDAGLGTAKLGVIPLGRCNDFAFSMGLPTNWKSALKVLTNGHSSWIDVGRVSGGLYPGGRYFGNGVGVGFDASVDFVASKMKFTGLGAYLNAAMQTLATHFENPMMEISLDDQTLTQNTLMVSIMNGRRMGGILLMTPNSQPDDGLLDLCITGKCTRAQALAIIPSFFNGSQHNYKSIVSFSRSRRVRITALEGTLPAHADGETICTQSKELLIELFSNQVELVCERSTVKPPRKLLRKPLKIKNPFQRKSK